MTILTHAHSYMLWSMRLTLIMTVAINCVCQPMEKSFDDSVERPLVNASEVPNFEVIGRKKSLDLMCPMAATARLFIVMME